MTLFIQNPGTCLLSKYDRIPEINGTQCDRVKYNDNIEDIDVNDDVDHTPLLPPHHHCDVNDVNVVGTLSSLRKTRKS